MGDIVKCLYCKKEFDEHEIGWGAYYEAYCPFCGHNMGDIPHEYVTAELKDLETVYTIVQSSIKEIYPLYYPQEVVDFFSELHSREAIQKDIEAGTVGILFVEGIPVGTGSYERDKITRVYVVPEHQRNNYDSYIMYELENIIGPEFKEVYLDALLPACLMYEERGYLTLKHEKIEVKNGKFLVYEKMVRQFPAGYFL